jgi:hypothetical protein
VGPVMGRGHHGLSHGGLSPKIESQIESSHEEYIAVGPVAVAPVMRSTSRWVTIGGSSRWVQSVGPVTRRRS